MFQECIERQHNYHILLRVGGAFGPAREKRIKQKMQVFYFRHRLPTVQQQERPGLKRLIGLIYLLLMV